MEDPNRPRRFTNPVFARPEGGMPAVVANAIGQRFAQPQPAFNGQLTPAQRRAIAREEAINLEQPNPMMMNVQVAQQMPMPLNPLNRTLDNTRRVSGNPERVKYTIKPTRET